LHPRTLLVLSALNGHIEASSRMSALRGEAELAKWRREVCL
jgi:hypothetical protein